MYPMEEPFVKAELAFRRERIFAEQARAGRRRRRRRSILAGRQQAARSR